MHIKRLARTAVEVHRLNMLLQKARVHPRTLHPSAPTYFTSKQETFTIWMKSLVLSGKGCTVFDSNGQVVYRVDNYNRKYCNEVQLMDFQGRVLFTILRKKFKLFRLWEGYRSWTSGAETENKRPCFQVRPKIFNMLRRDSSCNVVVGFDQNKAHPYEIENRTGKLTCKIVDKQSGELIAEVKRKQSKCGVVLGEDVLTMIVEPRIDHCLAMALFLVSSFVNCKM